MHLLIASILSCHPAEAASATRETVSEDIYDAEIDEVIKQGRRMLRHAHRDVYGAMHAAASDGSASATDDMDLKLRLGAVYRRRHGDLRCTDD